MFEAQILIIAAQQEAEDNLDENGMEPFENIMREAFWDLLITKKDQE